MLSLKKITVAQHILPGQSRPVARIDGGGGLRNPKYVDILDPKSGLFELHPLTLLQTPIFAHFVAKSGAFGMGGALHPPHPPWLS